MKLSEAIAQRQQNAENQFFTNLMQFGMNNDPVFDTSGDTPVYKGDSMPLPSKTEIWNQYVQIKGGRLSPQDLGLFEQYYNSVVAAKEQNTLKGLQNLANRGYEAKDIRKIVKDTPDLYNNLLDMISDAEATQTPEGLQQAAAIKSFMPLDEDESLLSRASEFVSENPISTGLGTYGALRGGEYLLSGKSKGIAKRLGLEDVSEKKTPKSKAKARVKNIRKLTPKVGTSLIASAVAPEIGEAVAGETGREVGEYLGGGLMTAAGIRGLLGLTSKVPHPIAKGIGYGGLTAMGLYDLYNTATEE
tara:strand:- start:186 stop:1094 length:909 start_codon:yes stop_codon:yes gene_type:complete